MADMFDMPALWLAMIAVIVFASHRASSFLQGRRDRQQLKNRLAEASLDEKEARGHLHNARAMQDRAKQIQPELEAARARRKDAERWSGSDDELVDRVNDRRSRNGRS